MNKTTLIIIGAIIILAGGYFYLSGTPSSDSSVQVDQSSTDAAIGSRVLSILNQIQKLQIDTSIFKDPAYLSLQDHSVEIPAQNVGRPNPFAPLPGVPSTAVPKK